MMTLNVILMFAGVAAVASIANLFIDTKKPTESIPLEKSMPGNLPIIALSNNGNIFNFILDSGSNISHICREYYECLDGELLGTYEQGQVTGLGGTSNGVTMCKVTMKDVLSNEYTVNLSVNSQLINVAKQIESNTGVQIHGLLGTDFLQSNNYVLDFKSLAVYPQK